jgi:hypothetical protein
MRVLDTRSRELAAGCRIAPIVGCILTLINLLAVFLEDGATTVTFVKTGLNFCVPFVRGPEPPAVCCCCACRARASAPRMIATSKSAAALAEGQHAAIPPRLG